MTSSILGAGHVFYPEALHVLLDGLPPYKGVLVAWTPSIDILHIKRYKAALGQQQHHLCEDVVNLTSVP